MVCCVSLILFFVDIIGVSVSDIVAKEGKENKEREKGVSDMSDMSVGLKSVIIDIVFFVLVFLCAV